MSDATIEAWRAFAAGRAEMTSADIDAELKRFDAERGLPPPARSRRRKNRMAAAA
jgi:hypothetical protein